MARLKQRSLFLQERKRHPFEVGLSPRLLGAPEVDIPESDGPEVPRILRNQGIRLGSAYAGQTVSTVGAAVTASGTLARNASTGKPVRYESVKKSTLRSKGYTPERGVSYLPERDSSHNRWHEKRLSRKNKPARTPGTLRIRMGTTMMVAGRLLPVIAIGYIAYEVLPDYQKSNVVDAQLPGGSLGDRADSIVGLAGDVYTGYQIGYHVGKGLLGVFS